MICRPDSPPNPAAARNFAPPCPLRNKACARSAALKGASGMGSAVYRIVTFDKGWGVAHDGSTAGPYATKEAAFEATAAAASIALREGHAVEISAPGRVADHLAPVQQGHV